MLTGLRFEGMYPSSIFSTRCCAFYICLTLFCSESEVFIILLLLLSLLPLAPAGVIEPADTGGLCPLLPPLRLDLSFEAEFMLELNDCGP